MAPNVSGSAIASNRRAECRGLGAPNPTRYNSPMSDLIVQREEHGNRGSFFLAGNDPPLAKMTFSRTTPTQVIIDHTEVSDALRGQGAGRKLLEAAVAWARETKTKIVPTCPYAKAQFDKDPSIRDVLAA